MKRLSKWLAETEVDFDSVSGDADVSGIASDSRAVRPGSLFVCMPSVSRDTHQFLPEVQSKGASAALVHSDAGMLAAKQLDMAAILVRDEGLRFPEALWRLARALTGDPTRSIRVTGVTGTNGKTTTAWLMRDALEGLGRVTSYLGTLGLHSPGGIIELGNTTPFSVELNYLLREAAQEGTQDMVMEVSSHALAERRADGVEFDAGVFTNLTQDHLDFHGNMEAYAAAKQRLFSEIPLQSAKRFVAAINVDDPLGQLWTTTLDIPILSYGVTQGDLQGEPLDVAVDGIRLGLHFEGKSAILWSKLGGRYNVENLLSAAAGLLSLGYALDAVVHGLTQARPVPGRFEAIPNDRGIHILVDYAHTPDALSKLLDAVKESAKGRILTVFGCGGDRDRTKRPLMAAAASSKSDLTIVTSDNPRTEDPKAIVDEVAKGIVVGGDSKVVVDRKEAVAYAIAQAKEGDVVVIAGKGHENYQIIGKTKHPMDDRELAREALEALP